MKEGTKLWNTNAKKSATFLHEENGYVYILLNGLVTPLLKEKFLKLYEVIG